MKLLTTLAVHNQLGEGVLWHPSQTSLWWTDIQRATLYHYQLADKSVVTYPMPERVACFAFTQHPDQLLIAFASGLALYHLSSAKINWLAKLEYANRGHRLNDGRLDRHGRFWVGAMVEDTALSPAPAALYQLTSNTLQVRKSGIRISNSLCFSPDGNTLYHADSPTGVIYQYPLSGNDSQALSDQLSHQTTFATTQAGIAPDGACIDKHGNLWSAQWGGSRVVQYNPCGKVLQILTLPVSQPTCVAIGGPNRDLLAITSARDELSSQQLLSQPEAGNVFIYQLNESIGIDERFADLNDLTLGVSQDRNRYDNLAKTPADKV
ncbi:SMP-30/gluconolactonase/LRE family protein [Thalassotalea euphylliae]|uniref:SMP-30/gluconolactonase/LRE family protein n=1 Tax=Thalassotalea euphylliae TaxID=1655234 RepID=A0A3E0TMR8_9GAMM|nr:SMP-30/gluconolactonase/LRE family protein [Thalassotalea euphylliae]REL25637.1 SMP-30/gluconolactonase/LRE family protein [Thalassotalea euphylliae]